jgi:hypothetical protein
MTPRPEEIHINVTADWDDRILDYLRRKVGLYGEEPIEVVQWPGARTTIHPKGKGGIPR